MRIHKNTAARNIPIPMEMIFKTIFRDLPLAASFGWKSANRIRQTALALGKTGVDWVLGGRLPAPVLLRRTFERLGATYIKIGQLIASSPSIFPEDYVKEFQRCLDQTEPVAFKHMEKVLKNELGPRYIPDIFSHVAQTPLASASIAQVYAARLASGEDVVIKIQRPSVETILATDLNALYFAAVVLERLVPRLKHASLAGILSEIRRTVLEECNFIKEAENIEIFSRFLKHAGNPDVVTPKVYHQASSRRVLTLERLYGTPLTRRQDLLQSTRNPYRILGAAFEIWMESITECELFHADLHAGNILILDDGRVGFIDFGIVGRISEKTQTGVQSLIKSMLSMDYKTMAESMLAIGMTRKKVNIEDLAKDLEDFYVSMESPMSDEDMSSDVTNISGPNPSRPDQTEPDRALLEIVRIAETHGIRFPREFTLLLKQFLYFDSYRDILFDMTGDDMEGLMDDFMQKMEGFGPMPTR